jgi:hypothetical protein
MDVMQIYASEVFTPARSAATFFASLIAIDGERCG